MKQALYGYDNGFCATDTVASEQAENHYITALLSLPSVWFRRARTRRHLSTLTDERLKDVGISYSQMLAETDKPFWVK